MFNVKNLKFKKIQKFTENESGAFLPMFGVSAFALILGAGVAVDYSRMVHTKSRIHAAVDSAVLAAGNDMVKGIKDKLELRQTFDNFLEANFVLNSGSNAAYKVDAFSVNLKTGAIDAEVSTDVPMYITAIAGYSKLPVSTQSQAVFSINGVEVAMMLDVTGSMGGNGKLKAMKKAAKSAIDKLIPKNGKTNNVRIGLVPYSWSVNASKYYANLVTNNASNKCVTERADVTDIAPVGANVILADPRGSGCPKAEILPLTSKRKKLKNNINKYKASGYTAGHLGIAWTYYMLSENWQSVWKKDARPAAYDSNTKKVAILMTDGEFNTYYNGIPNSQPVNAQSTKSNITAKALCADMKASKGDAAGITVYTVAFSAPISAQQTLENCSSGAGYHFTATSETELVSAFEAIADSIQKLRLSR